MIKQRKVEKVTMGGLVLLVVLVFAHVICNIFTSTYVDVLSSKEAYERYRAELTAFHKITLGFPVSINTEGVEGLSAIPGIGPKISRSIVRERQIKGGFRNLDEIKSICGIGPERYEKVRPFLTL